MLDPIRNQTFRSLIFPYGNYQHNKKFKMASHKQNFTNMPATETDPIDCGGFPR